MNVGRWLFLFSLLLAPLRAHAQLGPFPVVTRQATFQAELIRRDADIIWIRRQSADGRPMPQAGIAAADVLGVRMPRPALFDAAERVRTAPRPTDDQFAAAHRALDRFILQARPFRDVPGIPADEAILLKGRLHDRQGQTRDAIRQ